MYEYLLKNILFPIHERVIRRRRGDHFMRTYEASQWLSSEELQALQLRKLNQLIEHCWQSVPFLQRHWRSAGLRPGALSSLRQLDDFPVLTKSMVRDNFQDMRSTGFDGTVLKKSTGGSTGEPFQFEYTQEAYARRVAVMWRGYRWAGAEMGRRTLYLWGASTTQSGWRTVKERVFHAAFGRRILNTFKLTESNVDEYIATLVAYKPRIIVGYVSPLAMVARRITENGVVVKPPDAVITGAESLSRGNRKAIEEAFHAPVFETYGCREVMLMAAECPMHSGLHVSADHLILQTLGTGGETVSGVPGEVCITDLHNYAMPLFRYLNGDLAVTSDRNCACGRGLPLLDKIEGRLLDMIRTPDGRTVPGEFFVHAMLEFPFVRHFQVIQREVDRVEVKLVGVVPLQVNQIEQIRAVYAERLGSACRLEINEVESIPLTSSGKRRVTVSEVAPA